MMKLSRMLNPRRTEEGKKATPGKLTKSRSWSMLRLQCRKFRRSKEALDDTVIEKDEDGSRQHGQIPRVVSYGYSVAEDTLAESEQDLILADLHKLEEERVKSQDRNTNQDEGPRSSRSKNKDDIVPDEVVEIRADGVLVLVGDCNSFGSIDELNEDEDDAESYDESLVIHSSRDEGDYEDDSESCSSIESRLVESAATLNIGLIEALFIATSSDDDSHSDDASSRDHDFSEEETEIREVATFESLETIEVNDVQTMYSSSLFKSDE
jgi:hypothetical protein